MLRTDWDLECLEGASGFSFFAIGDAGDGLTSDTLALTQAMAEYVNITKRAAGLPAAAPTLPPASDAASLAEPAAPEPAPSAAELLARVPMFTLLLGDNFYPSGVTSLSDPKWKSHWHEVFMRRKELHIPFFPVLGNHDYTGGGRRGNVDAQIAYTTSPENRPPCWQMPAREYSFAVYSFGAVPPRPPVAPLAPPAAAASDNGTTKNGPAVTPPLAEFFALDTNGAQFAVRRLFPRVEADLARSMEILRAACQASSAPWKIVYAHHPIYTKGLSHGTIGDCLRLQYHFEEVLAAGGVAAYFAGHEHRVQHTFHHSALKKVHHFVCGATNEGYYHGPDPRRKVDWEDSRERIPRSKRVGLEPSRVVVIVATVLKDRMEVRFLSSTCEEIYKATITPPAGLAPPV